MRHSKPPIVLLFCIARFSSERLQGRKLPACDASKQTFFTGGGCGCNPICVLYSVAFYCQLTNPAVQKASSSPRYTYAWSAEHSRVLQAGMQKFYRQLHPPNLCLEMWHMRTFFLYKNIPTVAVPNSTAVSVFCRAGLVPVEDDLNKRLRPRKLKFETLYQQWISS